MKTINIEKINIELFKEHYREAIPIAIHNGDIELNMKDNIYVDFSFVDFKSTLNKFNFKIDEELFNESFVIKYTITEDIKYNLIHYYYYNNEHRCVWCFETTSFRKLLDYFNIKFDFSLRVLMAIDSYQDDIKCNENEISRLQKMIDEKKLSYDKYIKWLDLPLEFL